MHIKLNKLLSSTRWSISYILLIPVVVSVVIAWNAFQRIDEFEQAHVRIAQSTTEIVAREISKRLKTQSRQLGIFAKREKELIHRIALSPEDENLKRQLDKKMGESFPDHFSISIADRQGYPITDDFDDHIGELCLEDLKSYAQGKPRPIRIHPNHEAYHIDIIVPWEDAGVRTKDDKNGGLLFVSFVPNFLIKLLELSSTPQHELMLINNNIINLIEITEQGSRRVLKRDNFKLTKKEQQRILYSIPVNDSEWNLVDFQKENLFSNYRRNIINFSLIIISIFLLGSILIIIILLSVEKRRLHAEKTKEEMFSLFNHDLRAPLNSIFGFLEVYTESDLCEKKPEQCRVFAKKAFANAMAMRETVDDILDVQKMEAGEMVCHFTEVDLVCLIHETVEMSHQYGLMNKVNIKINNERKVIYIKVDPRRIKQALTNLLSNAIKYSPENETVYISTAIEKDRIIISVADNGPGIDKEFQPYIFNKFAQSKSKLTRRVGGTGLGLSIVKHIVELHRGSVSFVSDDKKGTTFKLFLPL